MKLAEGRFYHVCYVSSNKKKFEGIVEITRLQDDITGNVFHVINNEAGWQLDDIYVCGTNEADEMFIGEVSENTHPELWL